jgi:hypothetical protein
MWLPLSCMWQLTTHNLSNNSMRCLTDHHTPNFTVSMSLMLAMLSIHHIPKIQPNPVDYCSVNKSLSLDSTLGQINGIRWENRIKRSQGCASRPRHLEATTRTHVETLHVTTPSRHMCLDATVARILISM